MERYHLQRPIFPFSLVVEQWVLDPSGVVRVHQGEPRSYGGVVTQRSAKSCTPVRFRLTPPMVLQLSSVEQWPEEPCVAGSNPAGTTKRWNRVVAIAGDCKSPGFGLRKFESYFQHHPRLAQLARASRLHRGGRGFESLSADHQHPQLSWIERLLAEQKVAGSNPTGCTMCYHSIMP